MGHAIGEDATEACRKLLLESKVKSLWRPQAVVIIKDSATVEQALKVLAEHKVLSAPVVVAPKGDESHSVVWPCDTAAAEIVGFVDVNGILMAFNNSVGASPQMRSDSMLARMRALEVLGTGFAQQPLSQLLKSQGSFDGDFLHSTHAGNATMLELVMYGFLDPKRRGMHEGEAQPHVVHRVAMFDSAGHISHVISQTDIVRFLMRHCQQLGSLGKATLEQLGWDRKPVASCSPETPATDAMARMQAQAVSSMAIVSVSGRLLGNFSASEMRTILAEHFGALALPVGEFVAQEHQTEYIALNRQVAVDTEERARMSQSGMQEQEQLEAEKRSIEEGIIGSSAFGFVANRTQRARPYTPGEEVGQALVLARPSTTFVEVMAMLLQHRIHRVYVVDEGEAPIGIVTCTDILRKVVEVATRAAGLGANSVKGGDMALPQGENLK